MHTQRTYSTGELARPAPSNPEAEQDVIAAVVRDNEVYRLVSEILKPEHFYDITHRRMWSAIVEMMDRDVVANATTLGPYLTRPEPSGLLPAVYLRGLSENEVPRQTVIDYAREIRNLHYRRECIIVAESMIDLAYDSGPTMTAEQLCSKFEAMMGELRPNTSERAGYEAFGTSAYRAMKTAERAFQRSQLNESYITGLSTGFARLDDAIGGLQSPDLIILAGRPGMGKTALATNVAVNVAKSLTPVQGVVTIASLEMSAEQVSNRIVCEQADVPGWLARRGALTTQQMEKIEDTRREIDRLPLLIDETGQISIAQLRMRLRRIKQERGLALVIVDYLQLLTLSEREQNRYQVVTAVSGGLKALAKELQVPVIALSQLSRKVEERELPDRRPHMGDLRESGAIEQDADIIVMMYREEYYLRRVKVRPGSEAEPKVNEKIRQCEGICECILVKNRHGPESTVQLGFDASLTRFLDEPVPRAEAPEEVRARAQNQGLSKNEQLALLTLRNEIQMSGDSMNIERVGAVNAVPVKAWQEAIGSKLLGDGRTPKDAARLLERMLPNFHTLGLIGKTEKLVWLTLKGEQTSQ